VDARAEDAEVSSPFYRRLMRFGAFVLAPVLFCMFLADILALGMSWLALGIPVGIEAMSVAWLVVNRAPKPPPPAPRLELKAPNPEPGQCPVCSMTDLAAVDEAEAFLGRPDRVVAYGPWRAHWDCAEVVPYEAPKPVLPPREVHVSGGSCTCFACELAIDMQAAEVARRLRTNPRPHDPSGLHGTDRLWTCRFCGLQRWAPGMEYAKNQLIEHARHDCPCHRQLGGKYGSAIPSTGRMRRTTPTGRASR
jgi:hypothetical protein